MEEEAEMSLLCLCLDQAHEPDTGEKKELNKKFVKFWKRAVFWQKVKIQGVRIQLLKERQREMHRTIICASEKEREIRS